ncbi:MAG: hypothetical protein R2883_06320 [Caldisericia bacterium]
MDGTIYNPATANSNISSNLLSAYPHLALDSNDNPHITWTTLTPGNSNIFYIRWDGANWLTVDGTIYDPVVGNANISTNHFKLNCFSA